jgi:hypothetical protein
MSEQTKAIEDGGPAFPVSTRHEDGKWGHQDGPTTWQCPGMTLRDYFAAKALTGFMSSFQAINRERPEWKSDEPANDWITPDVEAAETDDTASPANVAAACYTLADAMLAARKGGVA